MESGLKRISMDVVFVHHYDDVNETSVCPINRQKSDCRGARESEDSGEPGNLKSPGCHDCLVKTFPRIVG